MIDRLRRRLLQTAFLVQCLLFSGQLLADNVQFRHIGEKEGLKYTWVNDITSDSRGYIWFSTMYGAFRYDGFSFREYIFRSDDGKILRVNKVFEDSDSHIWFGTGGGVFSLNPHNGVQTHFTSKQQSLCPLSSDYIEDICEDADGNIWISCSAGVDILKRDGTAKSWRLGYCRSILLDSRENIWVAVGSNLMLYDEAAGDFSTVNLPSDISVGTITDLFQDSDNNIWISTESSLVRYELQSKSCKVFDVASGTLPNNLVRQTVQDGSGDIWAATEHGLVRISGDKAEFVFAESDNLCGLNDNAIYSLYCDRDDNLWVGTFFGGVNVRYSHYRMFSFMLSSTETFSASSKVVSGIMHSDGQTYIATENDGVYLIGPKGDRRHISAGIYGLSSGNIHSVCEDKNRNLWLGSYMGGLYMKSGGGTSFVNLKMGSRGAEELLSNNIYNILCDSSGNLWVGTQYGGLYRYDYQAAALRHITHGGLPGDLFIWDILEDSVGDIWLACHGGKIWRLRSSEGYKPEEIDSPVSTYVSICELSDGRLAFATETDGIICVNPSTLDCGKVTLGLGLSDNTVYSILQDDNGDVWFSTNSGLCQSASDFSTFTKYTINDGLPANRFNYNASERFDGKLYFGCTNGLVVVDPRLDSSLEKLRRVRFNDLYINNVRQDISPEGPLSSDINKLGVLSLEHWQNNFSIDFSNSMFGCSNARTFAYRMQGLDDKWHTLDASNRVDFIALSPGRYKLSVANVTEGKIMDNEASLEIRLHPVWWQSIWAKMIFSLLLLSAGIAVVVVLIQSSRHKHELEIEKLGREKEKELNDMKLKFFVNISHEFKTPLSLILGPVEQFMDSRVPEGRREKYFGIIKKNANKLLSLINELLAFREIQFTRLDITSFTVSELVSDVVSRYEWQFDDKGIAIVRNVSESLKIEADRVKLEKILDNLLSNAYKHCAKGDEVTVTAEEDGEFIRFSVRDTGEGIPPDKIGHIFDRFFTVKAYDMYSSGVGLSYVKSLVELHGGEISVDSKLGKFTQFTFSVPRIVKKQESVETSYGIDDKTAPLPVTVGEPDFEKEDYLKLASETSVLIVEDDTAMRELLVDHFSRRYSVSSTDSGEAASRLVRESNVDVVISDVMLGGGMSGFDLCRFIKGRIETSHIKVVLMTVLSESDYKKEGYLCGADSYVVKPFSFSMLELRVKNLIVSAYLSREKYRKIDIDLSGIDVPTENTDEHLIRKISSVIMENISDAEFGTDSLCLQVGMSKASLYRKMKALTGQSTNEFIQNFRLKYAARLLSESSAPISDIAYDVGFSDPYYFSRSFKKLFEMSPKQWRQAHGGDNTKK